MRRYLLLLVVFLHAFVTAAAAEGYVNEAHFLVSETARVMAAYAPGTPALKVAPAGPAAYRIEGAKVPVTITLAHHQWSAEDFQPLADALLGEVPAETDRKDPQPWDLLAALQTPATRTMLEWNRTVSLALDGVHGSQERHEQASLLLAVLAYREAAGTFWDARREFCAVTAHLALARAAKPGPAGAVANAILDMLIGRCAAADATVKAWSEPRLKPWAQAISRRARLDWRMPLAKDATTIERLAWAIATTYRRNAVPLLQQAEQFVPEDLPDWGRIGCQVEMSVESGHAFATGGLKDEFREIGLVFSAVNGKAVKPEPATLIPFLNGDNAPAATRRVIDVPRWGAFLQRHLAHRLEKAYYHCNHMWGSPESAAEIRGLIAGPFAKLRLTPMIQANCDGDPQQAVQATAAAAFFARAPDQMNHAMFSVLQKQSDLPKASAWWVSPVPVGTTFAITWRLDALGLKDAVARPALEAAVVLEPWRGELLKRLADTRGLKTVAERQTLYGSQVDDDLDLAMDIYHHTPESGRVAALTRLAGLLPNCWRDLAQLHVKAGREAEAVIAYEKFHKESTDAVSVSNDMDWLVTWYATHNRVDDAKKIAAECYEVFSHRGIETKAKLDERLGDLDAAEAALKALDERYNDKGPLLTFWKRTAAKRPASRTAMEAREKELFPEGRKPVKLADFTGAPTRGMRVIEDSKLSKQHGVKVDCIIVAIDGLRCLNGAQYNAIRDESTSEVPLRLIFWDGKAYREINQRLKNRRLNIDTADFGTPAVPAGAEPIVP